MTAGPPHRWVGIARQDCSYEPEPLWSRVPSHHLSSRKHVSRVPGVTRYWPTTLTMRYLQACFSESMNCSLPLVRLRTDLATRVPVRYVGQWAVYREHADLQLGPITVPDYAVTWRNMPSRLVLWVPTCRYCGFGRIVCPCTRDPCPYSLTSWRLKPIAGPLARWRLRFDRQPWWMYTPWV